MPTSTQSDAPPWLADLAPRLTTHTLGRTVVYLPRTASTNAAAHDAARTHAYDGTLVLTDDQHAGRGRMGRTWQAMPEANLTFSLLVHPHGPMPDWPLIGFAAAVAIARALETHAPDSVVHVKWPNDVLLDGRKASGLLLETVHLRDAPSALVVGIGINVNQDVFPDEIAEKATSLTLATGTRHDRAAVLADVLNHFEPLMALCAGEGRRVLLHLYSARLAGLGGPVVFHESSTSQPIEGRLVGLTDTGALQLDTADGLRAFRVGDLTTHAS